ncbi:HIT family protein [Candidatus Woesearchaeota archaeon]|nr:HIT family protein [Candidatus Woesearchaeota archaeon]
MKIYEDEKAIAELAVTPMAEGHIIVKHSAHPISLASVPEDDLVHLFYVASYAATAVFEALGGTGGTNIILHEGENTNSLSGEVELHVVPRRENDGLPFKWEPSQAQPAELEEVMSKIKDQTFFIGKEKEQPRVPHPEMKKMTETDDNYLIKQLRRLP